MNMEEKNGNQPFLRGLGAYALGRILAI